MCSIFFFSSRRRHTRWPRDWSSDVCSSDLISQVVEEIYERERPHTETLGGTLSAQIQKGLWAKIAAHDLKRIVINLRSEERRVGKECRSRWAADQGTKKEQKVQMGRTRRQE